MKKRLGILILASLLVLVACTGSISGELYIRDLLDLADDPTQVFFTKGTVSIETMGNDYDEDLKQLLKNWFRDASGLRKQTVGYTSYIVADISIPVAHLFTDQIDFEDDLLSVIVLDDNPGLLDFGVLFNQDIFALIQEDITKNYYPEIELKDWTISLELKNDTRVAHDLYLQSVYANGRPIVYSEFVTIQPRETISLRFPDVLKDFIHDEGGIFFGSLLL